MNNRILAAIACAAIVSSVPIVHARQRATRERQVIVSVLEKNDRVATGLTPAEFVVREDGVAREVLRVEPATDPMQIFVLVDTSAGTQVLIPDLRKGVQTFASVIWARSPESEIALMEFGERPTHLADFSRSASVLDHGIERLNEHTGSGAYLLEAVADASKALKKKEAKRPIIAVFAAAGSREFSTLTSKRIEDSLKDANNTTLWALELQDNGRADMSDEGRERGVVLGDVTAKSGGTREIMLDRMNMEAKFTTLAERLSSQYALTYAHPDSLVPPSKLEVTLKRQGARLLAPKWSGK